MNKINQQNRNRLTDREQLTAVKSWGTGRKNEAIKKKNPHGHRQQYGDYQREGGQGR